MDFMPSRYDIERDARRLRAEALRGIAEAGALKWTALKDRLWLALARNPRPGSPATPKG